jgi:hypothetical protein
MTIFWTYYLICLSYCFVMSFRNYRKFATPGDMNITPGLDAIVFLLLCWVLAPVDIFLTFVRLYKDAEQARRNATTIN